MPLLPDPDRPHGGAGAGGLGEAVGGGRPEQGAEAPKGAGVLQDMPACRGRRGAGKEGTDTPYIKAAMGRWWCRAAGGTEKTPGRKQGDSMA